MEKYIKPNKFACRCSKCGKSINIGEGYRVAKDIIGLDPSTNGKWFFWCTSCDSSVREEYNFDIPKNREIDGQQTLSVESLLDYDQCRVEDIPTNDFYADAMLKRFERLEVGQHMILEVLKNMITKLDEPYVLMKKDDDDDDDDIELID